MAFLFPSKARAGMPGAPGPSRHLVAGAQFHRLLEGPSAENRAPGVPELAEPRPWWEFMPPGAEREAAQARGEVGVKTGARRLARGVRRRAAASVGRTLLEGRSAGRVERFAITEKPQTEEAAGRLAAYRKREKERKAGARAGTRSVLRGRGRYGTRR